MCWGRSRDSVRWFLRLAAKRSLVLRLAAKFEFVGVEDSGGEGIAARRMEFGFGRGVRT
jgi:hypothetical protein